MQAKPHPVAVAIARALFIIAGVLTLSVYKGLYISSEQAPGWIWWGAVSMGILFIVFACFDSPAGVVATAVVFFNPPG